MVSFACTNYVFDTGEAGELTERPTKTQTSTDQHGRARPGSGDQDKQVHNQVRERAQLKSTAGADEQRRARGQTDGGNSGCAHTQRAGIRATSAGPQQ